MIGEPLTIYVNVHHYGITNTALVTAYTGTVTTASDGKTGWRNVKNSDWNDISLTMTMENDSVYSFTINDINAFYAVPAGEEVVKLTFIARGSTGSDVSGQTSDIFIDVFKELPTTIFSYQPADATDKDMIVVTWNINDVDTPSRNHLQGYTDTAYIHTWGNGTLGAIVGPGWGENDTKWMCETVNDSIRRFYYEPSPRALMQFGESASVESLGILIRNKAANGQTNDFTIELDSDVDVDLSMVDPLMIFPATPTQDEPVYVYIDAKNYNRAEGGQLDPASTLSAWSGLITSGSSSLTDWKYQVNADWGGYGDSTLFERVNDSIHRWVIPSFADKYKINLAEEDVFRIALIARDTIAGAVTNQTDDLFFDVFGELPIETAFTTQPALVTENDAFVVTINPELADNANSLFSLLDTTKADTIDVYAHTGLSLAAYSDDIKDWQNVLAEWSENIPAAKAIPVTSNLVRFFVYPDARVKYSVEDSLSALGVHLVLRNEDGTAQTADIYVPFDTTGINLGLKPVTGVQLNELGGVIVYPNPASDVLFIEFDKAQSSKVNFYNTIGQVLYTRQSEKSELLSIDVSEFAQKNSLMFYTIESEGKIKSGKILLR